MAVVKLSILTGNFRKYVIDALVTAVVQHRALLIKGEKCFDGFYVQLNFLDNGQYPYAAAVAEKKNVGCLTNLGLPSLAEISEVYKQFSADVASHHPLIHISFGGYNSGSSMYVCRETETHHRYVLEQKKTGKLFIDRMETCPFTIIELDQLVQTLLSL